MTETLENMQETKDLMFSLVTIAPKILSTDNIKQKKFDLDRKLKSWLKFEPIFMTWLPKGKIEKMTVYLLYFLFIQSFSAIEIRLVFSKAKFMIGWLQWLEKRWGAHARGEL